MKEGRVIWMYKGSTMSAMGLFCLFSTAAIPGPKIRFDTRIFDAGFIMEGKGDRFNARFGIENSGDSVLRLHKVRPNCGCVKITRVDTLVRPGKTGVIESVMHVGGFRGGTVTKLILVASNAENEPMARLVFKGKIQAHIEFKDSYISLNAAYATQKGVYLATRKADLEITGIFFMADANSHSPPAWQNELSIPLAYTLSPTDSTRKDGFKVFRLDFQTPEINASVAGEFTISTNHPEKPEIRMAGSLLR